MSRLTLVHYRSGISLQCSNDCVCQNGAWLIPCTDPICDLTGRYIKGIAKPNYPMPAIRTRTFEYWRNLGEVSALNNFDIEVVQRLSRYR